jgi:hypothetical protein
MKFVYNSRPNSEERLEDCFEEKFFNINGLLRDNLYKPNIY